MPENPKTFKNKVLGCIMGGILGDALGSPLEFLDAQAINSRYPHLVQASDVTWVKQAEFTDDTCQMLEIINSIIELQAINTKNIGDRFYRWMIKDGRGIGKQTQRVLMMYGKLNSDIQEIAKVVWENTGRSVAGNGGVMRTAPIGLYYHNHISALIDAADTVCKITHYDPRCRDSCIALCLGISQLLHGKLDYAEISNKLPKGEVYDIMCNLSKDSIAQLRIDGVDMGYTVHTTRIAFLTLLHAQSFEEGLLTVFRKGGDVDTNGIVAGSLLGSKFGLDGIPPSWLTQFRYTQQMMEIAEKFYTIIPL